MWGWVEKFWYQRFAEKGISVCWIWMLENCQWSWCSWWSWCYLTPAASTTTENGLIVRVVKEPPKILETLGNLIRLLYLYIFFSAHGDCRLERRNSCSGFVNGLGFTHNSYKVNYKIDTIQSKEIGKRIVYMPIITWAVMTVIWRKAIQTKSTCNNRSGAGLLKPDPFSVRLQIISISAFGFPKP